MTPSFSGLGCICPASKTVHRHPNPLPQGGEPWSSQDRPRPQPREGALRAGVFAQAKQARTPLLASRGRSLLALSTPVAPRAPGCVGEQLLALSPSPRSWVVRRDSRKSGFPGPVLNAAFPPHPVLILPIIHPVLAPAPLPPPGARESHTGSGSCHRRPVAPHLSIPNCARHLGSLAREANLLSVRRENHGLAASCTPPTGPSPRPRHVSCPGTEPAPPGAQCDAQLLSLAAGLVTVFLKLLSDRNNKNPTETVIVKKTWYKTGSQWPADFSHSGTEVKRPTCPRSSGPPSRGHSRGFSPAQVAGPRCWMVCLLLATEGRGGCTEGQ